jgi:hypothetical protein
MPTARSANEREVSSRLCATRQGDSLGFEQKTILFEYPLKHLFDFGDFGNHIA